MTEATKLKCSHQGPNPMTGVRINRGNSETAAQKEDHEKTQEEDGSNSHPQPAGEAVAGLPCPPIWCDDNPPLPGGKPLGPLHEEGGLEG